MAQNPFTSINTPERILTAAHCPMCGSRHAIDIITPSINPVDFPGSYCSTSCPDCDYHNFEYQPTSATKPAGALL
jgi:C4-type Zn-finger protein